MGSRVGPTGGHGNIDRHVADSVERVNETDARELAHQIRDQDVCDRWST